MLAGRSEHEPGSCFGAFKAAGDDAVEIHAVFREQFSRRTRLLDTKLV